MKKVKKTWSHEKYNHYYQIEKCHGVSQHVWRLPPDLMQLTIFSRFNTPCCRVSEVLLASVYL